MDLKEYYTVSETAALLQISKQTIYDQMERRLKPYVKIIDGQKYINSIALKQFYSMRLLEIEQAQNLATEGKEEKELENGCTATDNSGQQQQSANNNNCQQVDTTINNQYFDLFQQEIESLHNIIKEKDKQISEKDKQISDLHILLSQQQKLQLDIQDSILLLKDKEKENTEKKKSFFDKFKRNKD